MAGSYVQQIKSVIIKVNRRQMILAFITMVQKDGNCSITWCEKTNGDSYLVQVVPLEEPIPQYCLFLTLCCQTTFKDVKQ